MASFEQAIELAKNQIQQRIKNQLKNEARKQVVTHFTSFWYVYLILFVVFMFFYLIAAVISSSQTIAATSVVSERILPPQIYVENLEKKISSGFGERRHPVTGIKSFHNGIDIALPIGTPVASSIDGVVKTVFYPDSSDSELIRSEGIKVTVEGTDPLFYGTLTRYLHLKDAYVIPGQVVKKGQIIGLSGNTGRSTGPHLHFEIIPDSQEVIDPAPFVLTMSQLTDVASDAAFEAMSKISWYNMSGYDYVSDQQLYISNVYIETNAPLFNDKGVVYTRNLNGGEVLDTRGGGGGSYIVEPVVIVPQTLGTLTDPFFIRWAPLTMAEEERSGVKASVTLAQMALESAYGKSHICNNLFGIKANSKWSGATCEASTSEQESGVSYTIRAKFRAYNSFEDSLIDHSNFLLLNSRYKTALSKENPFELANELQGVVAAKTVTPKSLSCLRVIPLPTSFNLLTNTFFIFSLM